MKEIIENILEYLFILNIDESEVREYFRQEFEKWIVQEKINIKEIINEELEEAVIQDIW